MAEHYRMQNPDFARPGTTTWRVASILLDLEGEGVTAYLLGENGEQRTLSWSAVQDAGALLQKLTSTDLSSKGLQRLLFEAAAASNKLPAGEITSTVEARE